MGKCKEKENERKLTKEEEKRKVEFEDLKSRLEAKGYKSKELTVGLVFANIMAVILWLPFAAVFMVWFFKQNEEIAFSFGTTESFILVILMLLLIVVHELIHGIFWAIFAKGHWSSVSFGFMVKYLTPYCTCKEPLKKMEYIIGALMPTVILGILPSVAGVFAGSEILLFLGLLMIMGGGGDMTIVLKLLFHKSEAAEIIYVDHPYQCGLVVFER